jgi:hypothetical protein
MVFRISVKSSELVIDSDGTAKSPCECPPGEGSLEALEPSARVDAPSRLSCAGHQYALGCDEAHELGLRSLAAAARARPHRL